MLSDDASAELAQSLCSILQLTVPSIIQLNSFAPIIDCNLPMREPQSCCHWSTEKTVQTRSSAIDKTLSDDIQGKP